MTPKTFRAVPALLALAVAGTAQAAANDANLDIYGFVQLDYIQDFKRVDPDWDDTLRPSKIPTTDGLYGGDGQAILSVRQSRLGVKGDIPVEGSTPVSTRFEFDLFGVGDDAGQTTIRPRHIYGSWGNWLAGQTNTLFMDGDLFPNTVDYWGPSGMVFLRNPQIRWTPVSGKNSFAVAIEKPGNDVDTGVIGKFDPDLDPAVIDSIQGDEEVPDITAQFRMNRDWGHLQAAAILRKIGYETANTPGNAPSGNESGWGLDLSSNVKFGDDTLRVGVVYGEGIASYMNDGGVDLAPDASGKAEAVPLLGLTAYYDHAWDAKWSTAFGYSSTSVDNTDGQAADAFETGEYASVNLLHTPAKGILVGVEALWGQRTDNDGASGEDTRIQTTIKYDF